MKHNFRKHKHNAVDIKGMETDSFKIKRREAEAAYPWLKIEIVK